MRANLRILVAVAATRLVAPMAMAESVEDQLQLMNERMEQLENQLDATNDELDASKDEVDRQQVVMEKAGLERQATSGISAFYQNVEISGHIAGSWFWNFNDPSDSTLASQGASQITEGIGGGSTNGGFGGAFYPYHPDHNSFSLDQFWLTLKKPATEESRAGFGVDMVYGKTASIMGAGVQRVLGGGFPSITGTGTAPNGTDVYTFGDSASDFNLFQAYIEYLTPWGPSIKVGKFSTWLGYETPNTTQNFNITRGNVWTLLQPVNHYGVAIEGDANGFIYGLAVVNDSGDVDPDYNNDKHIMAKLGYGTEMFMGQVAFLWGEEFTNYGNNEPVGTVDLLLTADPTENFSAWFNFDYKFSDSGTPHAWGAALAGRYAFTEKLGYALRGEFVQINGGSTGAPTPANQVPLSSVTSIIGNSRDTDIYGVTGTLDYLITDGLTLKWEVRYDYIDSNPSARCGGYTNTQGGAAAGSGCSNQFVRNAGEDDDTANFNAGNFTRRSQVATGLELVYQF
jgi:hypothetical protein